MKPPVVILCGGQGTRLREQTEFRPKPMIDVGGRPIVWHIMKHYARFGCTHFILALGYKGEQIKEYFLNYDKQSTDFTVTLGNRSSVQVHPREESDVDGWRVTLTDTGEHALTGARVLRAVSRFAKGERFLLTYGDGVSDVDIDALIAFHEKAETLATVTGVRPPARFGELLAEGALVREFSEKPQTHAARINGGFFVIEPGFLRYLSDDDRCTLEREPLERAAKDEELALYPHDGFWQCMDTLRDHQYLESLWRTGAAPWKTW